MPNDRLTSKQACWKKIRHQQNIKNTIRSDNKIDVKGKKNKIHFHGKCPSEIETIVDWITKIREQHRKSRQKKKIHSVLKFTLDCRNKSTNLPR